jgi:hypothetical protein
MFGRNRLGTTRLGAVQGATYRHTKAVSDAVAASSSLARATSKAVAAATVATSAGIVASKLFLKAVTASVGSAGSLARATGKILAGAVTTVGTIRPFDVAKAVAAATVTTSGSVPRAVSKAVSGATVATSGGISAAATYLKTIAAATVATSASLTKAAKRSVSALVTAAASIRPFAVAKAISGSVATSGGLSRAVTKAVSAATVGTTAAVQRAATYLKAIALTTVSTAGAIVVTPAQVLLGGVSTVARIAKKAIHKTVAAQVGTAGTLSTFLYDIVYAMNQTIRRIFAKVQITYTDPYFSAGVETEADAVGRYTYTDQTVDNVTETAAPWFSLHRNNLMGDFYALGPGGGEHSVGWWGTQLSDAVTGAFSVTYPILTITHAARAVAELLVVGDDKLDEYPVDFEIKLYDDDDTLLHTESVTGNTSTEWTGSISPMVEGVTKQTLEITTWSRTSAVCKIAQFFTTLEEVYLSEDGDIVSLNVAEQREYTGMTIPQGNLAAAEIRVRLNNIDGIFDAGNRFSRLYGQLLNNRAIQAWLGVDLIPSGVRRWYPLGTFYSRDWNAPDDEIWAEVSGQDTLARLQTTTFSTSEVYEDQSLQDLAVIVMTDAGLTSEDWEIDPALDAITVPYAWFDPTSHRECLRKIAAAALGQCYCNRDGKIVLEVYDPSTVLLDAYAYTTGNVFSFDHPLAWSQMVNRVEAQAQPRVPSSEQEILTDSEAFTVPAGGTITKTHFFVLTPCIDVQAPEITADPDISVDSWTAYSWGISVTYANAGAGDGQVTEVTVDGKILEIAGGRVAVAEDASSIARNGLQTLPAPIASAFWQDEDTAQSVADSLLSTYKNPRKDIVMTGRGNIAQLLGDRVTCPDSRTAGTTAQFGVVGQDITFDGGLEVTVAAQRLIMELSKSLGATVGTTGAIRVLPVELVRPDPAVVSTAGVVTRKTGKILSASVGTSCRILTGEWTFQATSGSGTVRNREPVYLTARNAASGDQVLFLDDAYLTTYQSYYYLTGPVYELTRGYLIFETGDIIAAGKTITAAELWFYPTTASHVDATWSIVIQDGQPTYPHDPIEAGDWDQSQYSGNGGSIACDDITTYSWNKIDLNATGLTWVQKGAGNKTKLCLRTDLDIAGTPPGTALPWEFEGILCSSAHWPYVVVYWEA